MATQKKYPVPIVGRRLQAIRKAKGISAAKLADLIPDESISKTMLTNVEGGRKQDLTVTEMLLVANALQVSPLSLIVDPSEPWSEVEVPGIQQTNIAYALGAMMAGDFDNAALKTEVALDGGEVMVRAWEAADEILRTGKPTDPPQVITGIVKPSFIVSPAEVLTRPRALIQQIHSNLERHIRMIEKEIDSYQGPGAPPDFERRKGRLIHAFAATNLWLEEAEQRLDGEDSWFGHDHAAPKNPAE